MRMGKLIEYTMFVNCARNCRSSLQNVVHYTLMLKWKSSRLTWQRGWTFYYVKWQDKICQCKRQRPIYPAEMRIWLVLLEIDYLINREIAHTMYPVEQTRIMESHNRNFRNIHRAPGCSDSTEQRFALQVEDRRSDIWIAHFQKRHKHQKWEIEEISWNCSNRPVLNLNPILVVLKINLQFEKEKMGSTNWSFVEIE